MPTELSKILGQTVITLRSEQVRNQPITLDEEDLHLLLSNQLAGDVSNEVTLAAARQASDILPILSSLRSPSTIASIRDTVSNSASGVRTASDRNARMLLRSETDR